MRVPDRVRFLPGAIDDLRALERRDPQIVRLVFAKILLINENPYAGEPLLGGLVGFRKLVIGDRHWRIVWRIADDGGIEIAEVWGVGARQRAAIYAEIEERLANHPAESPLARGLADLLTAVRTLSGAVVIDEPDAPLPDWLRLRLREQLLLTEAQIDALTPDEAMEQLQQFWSRPR